MKLTRKQLRKMIINELREQTYTDPNVTAANELGKLGVAAARKKLKPDFVNARDKLLNIKKDVKILREPNEFTKDLAGAYYFGINKVDDASIEAKFGITGTDAIAQIDIMMKS